jgi:suppressor of G2 allele of SKP1
MASHAARGKKALEAKEYDAAIQAYTDAIKEFPTSPDYFIQRSTAYQRAQKTDEALRDAEQAVVNAQQRGKKDLIIEAQQRRGIALCQLGRYGDAQYVLNLVKEKSPEHKNAIMWLNKIEISLRKLEADDERRKVTATETPIIEANESKVTAPGTAGGQDAPSSASTTVLPVASAPPAPQQTPASKIRHEWYQNTEHIYFTLLARGVPKDQTEIETTSTSLSISFPLVTDSTYEMTLDPLYAPILAEKTITKVMPSKVEIILFKAQAGQKWPSLEGTEATHPMASDNIDATSASHNPAPPKTIDRPPAYPTSSRTGPKNWDTITSNLSKKSSETATADGATTVVAEEDDDDDTEGGDATNNFFKKLYKNATPEVRRAMMKSYTESNGTSLSTSWDEVKKGKVETLPPDGMEAKEW